MHACRWGHTSEPWRQTPPICIWRVRGRDLQQVAQATMMELPNAVGLTLSPRDRMGGPIGNYKKPYTPCIDQQQDNVSRPLLGGCWAWVGDGGRNLSPAALVGGRSCRRGQRSPSGPQRPGPGNQLHSAGKCELPCGQHVAGGA